MHLILTSALRLHELYGSAGLAQVEKALDELAAARAAAGIRSRRYSVERGLPDLDVAGVQPEWRAVAVQVGQIDRALRLQSPEDSIESVLIIGGPRVVPFGELDNPVADRDKSVPTDCVYGAADVSLVVGVASDIAAPRSYGLDWPVGRLPDAAEVSPTLLTKLIRAAAAQHRRSDGLALAPMFGYSTAAWEDASRQIFAEATRGTRATDADLVFSPPTTADTLDRAQFGRARLIVCNLHGVREGPIWYGQAADDWTLVPALRPRDVSSLDLNGAILLTEACYGASLGRNTVDSSLALMVLSGGVLAFVGAGVITYGPPEPPSGEADLLALHFIRLLQRTDTNIGDVFLGARLASMRDALLDHAYLDEDDEKTILGFVLYGDPTIRVYPEGNVYA